MQIRTHGLPKGTILADPSTGKRVRQVGDVQESYKPIHESVRGEIKDIYFLFTHRDPITA
jgi:hypothetical protein